MKRQDTVLLDYGVVYEHRRRAVPDSDGLCGYVIRTPAGTYVSRLDPLYTTLAESDALVFLWSSTEAPARFLALANADVRLAGSAPIRRYR